MAMEKLYVVRDTHTRSITALGYNPARREILMGCEGMLYNFVVKTSHKFVLAHFFWSLKIFLKIFKMEVGTFRREVFGMPTGSS